MRDFVDYNLIDQKITSISSTLNVNILFYITPQNLVEEKQNFFEELKKGNVYNPKFIYPSKNPLFNYFSMKPSFDTYKNELTDLIKKLDNDPFGILCENKILDLLEKMELIKSIGTPNFAENSIEFFGDVDKKIVKLAIEQVNKPIKKQASNKLSKEAAVQILKDYFKKKKLKYKIVFRDHGTSQFSVNPQLKILYISNDVKFTDILLKRLIVHEIQTHLFRYENALLQPYSIFSFGGSKIATETEEGLAVTVEKLADLQVDEQLKVYAGRVLAINLAKKKSFYETFEALTQFFSDEDAFRLALRAKRGVFKQYEAGAFTKDLLYFKGKFLVEDFLKDNPIEDLYYGKHGVEETYLIKQVDGIKKPKYLPDIKK